MRKKFNMRTPSSTVLSFDDSAQKWHRTCESPKTYGETKSVNKRAKTRRRHKRSSVSPSDKESAPSADDYEMPGRPKGGHGARKKGHKQKQSVPPWAYPSPPLSHPPPFPGFPPYSDDSDIWDDAALIKAYDKAVTSFKTALKNGTATCESPQDLRGDKVREQAGEDTETAQEEQRVALRQGRATCARLPGPRMAWSTTPQSSRWKPAPARASWSSRATATRMS
ncbi:uncharacterized protein LOC142922648 isoform X2 [Petromyzon marinus]|uniref:uncharacterized protein LOC142922648 isoform X2 n=1 Tax=Petromyzon marinus TaxID=7757 RepID=UPI003F7113CB